MAGLKTWSSHPEIVLYWRRRKPNAMQLVDRRNYT